MVPRHMGPQCISWRTKFLTIMTGVTLRSYMFWFNVFIQSPSSFGLIITIGALPDNALVTHLFWHFTFHSCWKNYFQEQGFYIHLLELVCWRLMCDLRAFRVLQCFRQYWHIYPDDSTCLDSTCSKRDVLNLVWWPQSAHLHTTPFSVISLTIFSSTAAKRMVSFINNLF